MDLKEISNKINKIAIEAGKAILEIYENETLFKQIDFKADDSPLTLADQKANEIIVNAIKKEFSDIPFISEEEKQTNWGDRKDWEYFFLIDPLDGTKEFIKRNGEFTVNIALIHNKRPTMGVIYAPVLDTLYWGYSELNKSEAFKKTGTTETQRLESNFRKENRTAVRSKSHATKGESILLEKYDISEEISVGSSLKFCMVAEGKADLYYREGPTMEWDTAAGQAIVEATGGKVFIGNSEENEFRYNKENLLNSGFLVIGRK